MAQFFDDSWKLSTADLIQQIAAYLWIREGDDHKKLYEKVTGTRVVYELYSRLTTSNNIDLYKSQCMMGIVDYIKAHPNATEAELTKEIQKQVETFKQRVDAL